MSISCAWSPESGSSCRSICIEPDIDASGLRISCAMPAAISPTAARRCCIRARALEALHLGDVLERVEIAAAAVRQRQRAPRSGRGRSPGRRAARELVVECACCARRRRSSSTVAQRRGVSCSTSVAGCADAAGSPVRPVIIIADRLKVSRRFCASAVASPLSRLSITNWLKACRSAISSVTCSSRTSRCGARARPASREQRHGEEAEHVQADGVERDGRPPAGRRAPARTAASRASGGRQVLRHDQADEQHRVQRRHLQPAAAQLHRAGRRRSAACRAW